MTAAARYSIYDGQFRIGGLNEHGGKWTAIDSAGKRLGKFATRDAALAAIELKSAQRQVETCDG